MTRIERISVDEQENLPLEGRRIAIVLPGLRAGGSEHVVSFLASRLVRLGYDVSIVNFETGEQPPYYPTDERVAIRYVGRPVVRRGRVAGAVAMVRRIADLRRVLDEIAPDLVLSFLTRTNVQTLAAMRGRRVPVVVSERNNPVRQDPGFVWRLLRKVAYPRAAGLITMTRGALDCFPKKSRKRGWVIPNMADFAHFEPQPHSGGPVMTAVGRLTHQKGFDLLIEAFSRIANRHPDWILRIWGEGPDRQQLEAQVGAAGLAGRVELPGVTERPGQWIETSDAFVLSSRFEGWGLVLGEAMAAGLPCVSFACPFGPEDMVTQGADGLLARDGDVADLAASLSQVMGDADLRERLASAAKASSRRFDPERIGQEWEAVIEQIFVELELELENAR